MKAPLHFLSRRLSPFFGFVSLLTPLAFAGVTVTFNNGDNLSAPLSSSGLNNPLALDVPTGTATQSGVISGTGRVLKAGGGTLHLTAINDHTGETVLDGGTLSLAGAGSRITATQYVRVGDGTPSTLALAGGASVQTLGQIWVGYLVPGTATVTGANTQLQAGTLMLIGREGLGNLTLSAGARAGSASFTTIGPFATGNGTLVVDGPNTLFHAGGDLEMAGLGTANVTVSNGGRIETDLAALLANGAGSNATVTVTGSGSTLQSDTQISVGDDGTATLNVANDGQVEVTGFFFAGNNGNGTVHLTTGGDVHATSTVSVGSGAGSEGIITVDGPGSVLSTGAGMSIGRGGPGQFSVTNGGQATASSLAQVVVGENAGITGSLTVSGANSLFQGGHELWIGQGGTGTVNVSGGGELDFASTVFVAKNAGSSGTLTVNGTGSLFNTAAGMSVGTSGTGGINVTNAGRLTTGTNPLVLGENAGATGSLSVTGTNSLVQTNVIRVGMSGEGTLTLGGGGQVEGDVLLAMNNGGTGTVNLNSGGTLVADSITKGTGTAAFKLAGGTLKASGAFASDVPVAVSGASSTINTNGVNVMLSGVLSGTSPLAKTGTGTLTLSGANTHTGAIAVSGGTLAVSGTLPTGSAITLSNGSTMNLTGTMAAGTTITVGNGATLTGTGTTNGTVTVQSGGAVTGTLAASVGRDGPETLTISGGAQVQATSTIILGENAGGAGTVTVTGNDSLFQGGSQLYVGRIGVGILNVLAGGEVDLVSTVYVGREVTGDGTVTVDGAGSLFHTDAGISVGTAGDGQFNLTNGGKLTTGTNSFVLGEITGGTGSLSVTGTNSLVQTNVVHVGMNGSGTLTIGNGGRVEETAIMMLALNAAGAGTVNLNAGGTLVTPGFGKGSGTAVINLAGGTLQMTGSLDTDVPVAVSGTGSTLDTNGHNLGLIGVLSGPGSFTKTGAGTLTLSGANTHTGTIVVSAGELKISGAPVAAETIVVNSGATLTVDSTLPAGGTISLQSGATLSLNGSTTAGHTITVANGATLTGTGTINGSVTVLPGGSIASTLTLSGPTNIQSVANLTPGSASGVTWDGSTNGSATAAFTLRDPAAASDRLTLTGTFARGSGSTFKFDFGGTGHATAGSPTTYTLVSFANTTFTSASAFSFTNLEPGLAGAFTLTGGALQFTATFDDTPPVVTAIRRFFPGGPGTAAERVRFQVIFNEPVTGVDAGDFVLTATGTATGTISAVIGSGPVRYVDVTGVSGQGLLRLDLKASGTGITDLPTNPIATGFTGGQAYARFPEMTAVAWGNNSEGALGDGTTTSTAVPVAVDVSALGGKSFAALVNGSSTSFGLSSDGKLYGWGANGSGLIGDGTGDDRMAPVATNLTALAGKAVVSFAAAAVGSFAVTADGEYFAWGSNANPLGSFGNQTAPSSSVPIAVNLDAVAGKPIVSIAASSNTHAVLTADGLVFEWDVLDAAPVDTNGALAGKAVVALAVGTSHKLALTSDGGIYAWGSGSNGQLGNGATANSSVPVAVDMTGVLAGKTVIAVAAGESHSVALTADGRAYSWGRASTLGKTAAVDSAVPVAVDTSGALAGKTIVALNAIVRRTEALTSDGEIIAWGLATVLGAATDSQLPTRIVANGALAGRPMGALRQGDRGRWSAALAEPAATAITNVAGPASASYRAGRALDFTVTFAAPVTVDTTGGTPSLGLTIGATARSAVYVSGTGTNTLVFRHTVQAGDTDADGIAVGAGIALNGGTVQDSFPRAAVTTFTAPNTAAVLVDTTAPSINSGAVASGTYRTAFSFSATATEPVTFGAAGLPAGLSIAANGAITGTPTASGPFNVALTATDAAGNVGNATLEITLAKVGLTVSGAIANNKVFDGTTAAPVNFGGATLVGVVAADAGNVTLNAAGATGTFATATIGANKPVTIAGLALAGSAAVNYTLTQPAAIASITNPVAIVTLSNLEREYDGLPKAATVATTPGGLVVNVTYNGSATPPSAPGDYTVVATVSDALYIGGATGTLRIEPIETSIALGNLRQLYDGKTKAVAVVTDPAGLDVDLVYVQNGNVVTPVAAGTYLVQATSPDPNYAGNATGTLVIAPAILTPPAKAATATGGAATFTVVADGGTALTYQWRKNGVALPGATGATLALANVQPADSGGYAVVVTGGGVSTTSASAVLAVALAGKVSEGGTEVGSDIRHPNGNIYDQVLVTGPVVSFRADPGEVVRASYTDLTGDIVQLEFSGAGTVTLTLENYSGPAPAAKYDQPDVSYVRGHATVVITGADASTNLGIFSVGRATAVNQSLFRPGETYDGWADFALVTIFSADGKFGGVRTGNTSYFNTKGMTGVHAPGVQFSAPITVGDISGSDTANAMFVTGAVTDASVAGGDLLQANGGGVEVSGMTRLQFTAGTNSHGVVTPAQANRARLMRNGVDVTSQLVQ